jgi:hypothetical protein
MPAQFLNINLFGVTEMSTMVIALTHSKVPLGQIVITANAEATLNPDDVQKALGRHASGDWGEVCSEDAQLNDDALEYGDRLLSVYRSGILASGSSPNGTARSRRCCCLKIT